MKASLLLAAALAVSNMSASAQQPGSGAATPKAGAATPTVEAPHKNVTPDEAEKVIQSVKDIVVVDVRTPEEFAVGHIAGAANVSLLDADFDRKIKEYQGKPLLLHCASGSRSARALTKMRNLQFPEIYHMNGGMRAWESAGKPVAK
jgi:rhodanese-related sulfurtransferase